MPEDEPPFIAHERKYSLKELVKHAQEERKSSNIGREKLDILEIDHLFKGKLKKKRTPRSDNKTFFELLQVMDPGVPQENRRLVEEYFESGAISGVEEAVMKGVISKKNAGELWANTIGVAYLDPLQSVVTDEALALIPEEIARKARVLPLYYLNGVLTIATSEPANAELIKRIKFITGKSISAVFSFPSDLRDAIGVHYSSGEDVTSFIMKFQEQNKGLLESVSEVELEDLAESEMISNIVEAIIHFGIKEGASDIHLEPLEVFSRVRFRVDGRLREILTISKSIHPAITSRLKILSRLNIAENRFPQDGRFDMPLGMSKAEFRISCIPSIYGQKVVIRILGSTGRKGSIMSLDDMLISQNILKPYRRVVRNSSGIIFVTGPTGSGKTTTLYATLQELNNPDVNISTIEDPVEIVLPGLTQSQVNHNISLNFPLMLRSLLRQDPDIMLVGEIRDLETAKIAAEAALTGHLVFATLHTNNAIQAVIRLMEIGLEPYMVAPSVNAVLSQRLAGRLDDKHKEAYKPEQEVLDTYFYDHEDMESIFYRPSKDVVGTHRAYKGRVALHELVMVSDEFRSLISQRSGTHELAAEAAKVGYRPLRYDGLKKALMGLTTLEEVERVTPQEWGH